MNGRGRAGLNGGTPRGRAVLAALATLSAAPVATASVAAEADAPAGRGAVTVCETLIAARRADSAGRAPRAAPEPDCRQAERGDVGAVERRALVGGTPYECRAVAGAAPCLWIVP